jgi:2-C-methyl-D-erythritol 2,4-cyclodiphosphate synthase
MRIGQGFDVHQLVPGRPLVLGGVTIPYELGLLGHSDADVLIHAMMDALLGAIGAGDIGRHFPDNDSSYQDIQSTLLLKKVMALVHESDYTIANMDATIIAQRPKVAGYIPQMREIVAEIARVEPARINIKATTTEGLGFTGRGEGIAAMAVVLLA